MRLFRKSNPPLLEWLRSPIVYAENYPTAESLRELSKEYFNPKSCLHHYLHMAERNYREYLLRDDVRVKKYFYVLRPILACDWIFQHNTMAPVEFRTLLDTQLTDEKVKEEVAKLLVRKMAGGELKTEPRIDVLNDFLESKITFYNEYVKSLGKPVQPTTDSLNLLFKETLLRIWG